MKSFRITVIIHRENDDTSIEDMQTCAQGIIQEDCKDDALYIEHIEEVEMVDMIVCQRCNGTMRIPDYEENGVLEDGMMPCPECEGEGEVENDDS